MDTVLILARPPCLTDKDTYLFKEIGFLLISIIHINVSANSIEIILTKLFSPIPLSKMCGILAKYRKLVSQNAIINQLQCQEIVFGIVVHYFSSADELSVGK